MIVRFLTLTWMIAIPALAEDWSPRLAADYLDGRQKEWFAWQPASVPGGSCVSCHTGVPYLLARPALRKVLGETEPTVYESGLLNVLRKGVTKTESKDLFPVFKKEPRATQAVSIVSILAAVFLALDDSDEARLNLPAVQALERLWSLQLQEGSAKGAWPWLDVNLDPWEQRESQFYGAALTALALGHTPVEYRKSVRSKMDDLAGYLQREQQSQPMHNRLQLLWASTRLPELLPAAERQRLVAEVWKQQQEDGGWTLDALGPWKAHPGAPAASGSNGYGPPSRRVCYRRPTRRT